MRVLQNLAQIFRKHLDAFTKKLIIELLLKCPLADALKSTNKDVQSLVNMQNKLNNMGTTNLILHLVSSPQHEYHQALQLGIAILHGGNEKVQAQFHFRLLERKRAQEHQRTGANAVLFRNDKFGTGIDNELTEGSYRST
ncbi:uncharacterized protein ACA1_292190 [Acanthamoeba castellanii str. Neff]|uniref:Uncharacterized protein n=1 Tax=Acanthamoeba castellanii (strain ATCC 30010 / Neff) TaxID=1257118 RepID=L8HJJ9_ACACF|nr:uncharacterized protein ACA1_292190 [Acanthamoeba castellanii str. Neff]ELR25380.1 hypothetical protein ACA1_292190 [Acanthamoeba castellanii str. Neff]